MPAYSPLKDKDIEIRLRIDQSPVKSRTVEEPADPPQGTTNFIKLIGIPPPNSDDAVTMTPINKKAISDPKSYCIDVLEAENEDPFTLGILV
jgi:hypothetical protein